MAVTITNDAATTRTNLGLGDAATKTVGTASGNIPVLDSSGKLASGRMPTFKTVGGSSIVGSGDISTLPSGGTANQVLTSDASSNATWQDAGGGGKVLQVISNSSDSSQGITTSETTVSGSSITITPVASGSSFLYVFDTHGYSNGNPNSTIYTIKRDGTTVRQNRVISKQTANDDHERLDIVMSILDVTPTYTLGNTLTYTFTVYHAVSGEHTMNVGNKTKGIFSYMMEIGA